MEGRTRFIFGCAIGNMLEWYDFILYGFFSPVLATLFFPHQDPYVSLLLTFTVFASACVVRPFSGVVFGLIGDTLGRKKALLWSVALVTLATTAMGCLPTYATVGVYAPLFLVVCRLFQGIAVSGEEVGAAILLAETATRARQGLMGSIILASVYLGLFFGALSALVITVLLTKTSLYAWGWRLPFLFSAVFGVFALKIRLAAIESPMFEHIKHAHTIKPAPIRFLFQKYKSHLVFSVLIVAAYAAVIYLFAVYLPSYYVLSLGFSSKLSLILSAASLFLAAVLSPLCGLLADRIGAYTMMFIACVGLALFAYPMFSMLAQVTLVKAILANLGLVLLLSLFAGAVFPLILYLFPTEIRYSGSCIGFNISMSVFGSTAPMITLSLQKYLHSTQAPFLYLLLIAGVSFFALLLRRDSWKKDLLSTFKREESYG
jgi:MHS family proline/betaine transporter-like MFS transporter